MSKPPHTQSHLPQLKQLSAEAKSAGVVNGHTSVIVKKQIEPGTLKHNLQNENLILFNCVEISKLELNSDFMKMYLDDNKKIKSSKGHGHKSKTKGIPRKMVSGTLENSYSDQAVLDMKNNFIAQNVSFTTKFSVTISNMSQRKECHGDGTTTKPNMILCRFK